MATQKKTLLELMVEAGIKWPDGAEYAAQDKDDKMVFFYKSKPMRYSTWDSWYSRGLVEDCSSQLPELCHNWHQTIVTKAQYEAAVAEQTEQPAAIEAQSCGSATPATIEQRITELQVMERNLAELRAELHEMERNLDEFSTKLTDDLHALGITWRDGAVVAGEPEQPVITDWRDLKVGDVVEITSVHKGSSNTDYAKHIGSESKVVSVGDPRHQDLLVESINRNLYIDGFRFIRRP